MTTTTQQLPSNPAIDFANAVLAETDNAREIINMLHDIAQGHRENSTANDRIAASKTLLDRGLGKCPKHISPTAGPALDADPDPESAESDNHTNHSSDTPQTVSRSEPDSPRLVTRLDDALNDSIGPAPSAEALPTDPTRHSREKPALVPRHGGGNPLNDSRLESPDPLDPLSIHFSIQQHILDITNNCRTLMTALTDICRTPDDNPRVTDYHRVRAGRMLLDRILGANPNAVRSAVCPGCRQSWTTHTDSSDHTEHKPGMVEKVEDLPSDDEVWAAIKVDLKRMEDKGILTPDPNGSPIDISNYRMPKDFDSTPYEEEEAAAFKAEIELRIERQKQWPEIEERRRKKLAQIYPSHSEDDKPPDP